MLRRAKRAAIFASPIVAVGVWAGVVLKERSEPPPDVRFSIGSAGNGASSYECSCSEMARRTVRASLRTKLHVYDSVFLCCGRDLMARAKQRNLWLNLRAVYMRRNLCCCVDSSFRLLRTKQQLCGAVFVCAAAAVLLCHILP